MPTSSNNGIWKWPRLRNRTIGHISENTPTELILILQNIYAGKFSIKTAWDTFRTPRDKVQLYVSTMFLSGPLFCGCAALRNWLEETDYEEAGTEFGYSLCVLCNQAVES